MESNSSKKYNKWVIALSILIPLVVASLFKVKLDIEIPIFLPPIYALINALTVVFLVIAVWAVKNKKVILHEKLIKTALICSVLFLIMYVLHHMTSESTKYGGDGSLKMIYFFILITHIILSVAVIPFVLITFVRGITNQVEKHKRIAKITFPLWLYVAVSGVVVYLMISPYY